LIFPNGPWFVACGHGFADTGFTVLAMKIYWHSKRKIAGNRTHAGELPTTPDQTMNWRDGQR
jgi:hypothetical protein